MRIKLDENLPETLVERLQAQGHDVDTVPTEGLCGAPDGDVFSAVQAEARVLITQDLDFSDIRRYVPGTHHGLVLVRAAACQPPTLSACSLSRTLSNGDAVW